jgi:hypothetical protein
MVHELGAVHLRFEHEAFCVHQDVALPAADLLAAVVSTLLSAYPGGLDRLGVHDTRAGLAVTPELNAQTLAYRPVHSLPDTFDAPFPEVIVDGGPRRKVMW